MPPFGRRFPSTAVPLRLPLVLALPVLVAATLTACGPRISTFNATAYEQATSLKVEARTLMDQATEPYDRHADDVRALELKLEKAHEFAKGRPKNALSARQWKLLKDPEGNLLGGFLTRWKDDSTLNAAYVREKKKQVTAAFDTIIELESGKIKPEDVRQGS